MSGIRKKRFWSEEEKRSICAQTTTPGVSVAHVARRYAMNANLIFKWLKDTRFAPGQDTEDGPMAFLPVEEGLRTVPAEMIEAADMAGASRCQKLLSVQLPLALPTMAVGFNQAIIFAFFMVIIAAFIGTQDLGQELQRTLAGTELGKNFVLGICVSLMALTFDSVIMTWTERRKRALGIG